MPETPNDDLFRRICERYQTLALKFGVDGITNITGISERVSHRFGSDPNDTNNKLLDLIERGPWNEKMQRKVILRLLEITFDVEIDVSRKKTVAKPNVNNTTRYQKTFSSLIQEYAFFGRDHTRSQSAQDFSRSLKISLNTRAPKLRYHLQEYVDLYSGTESALDGNDISLRAIQLIELLKIPSKEVIEVLPVLNDNLIYNDGVRKNFSDLTVLLRRHRLFTMVSFEKNFGSQLTPSIRAGLVKLGKNGFLEEEDIVNATLFLENIFSTSREVLFKRTDPSSAQSDFVEVDTTAQSEVTEEEDAEGNAKTKTISNRRRRLERLKSGQQTRDEQSAQLPSGPSLARQSMKRISNHLRYALNKNDHPLDADQVEIVRDLIVDIDSGNQSGYYIGPPGIGKTVINCFVLDALKDLNEEFIEDGMDGLLILVDKISTAEQTYETLVSKKRRDGTNKALFGWSTEDVSIYYGSGKNATAAKQGDALGAAAVIMTVASYRSLEKKGEHIRHRRPIVLIDEVDEAKGEVTTPIINALTQDSYVLGSSATDYHVGPNGIARIGPALFNRPGPFHETTWQQAADKKRISPIRNILCVMNLESGIERSLRGKKHKDYTDEDIEIIVSQYGRDDAAIRTIATFVDPDTGIAFKDLNQIWFCFGVRHAARIAAKLNAVYHSKGSNMYPYGYAMAVSGDTPKDDWVDEKGEPQLGLLSILQLHREGVIPVLTSADLLIRSFDSQDTSLCVMLRPFGTPTPVGQGGGRISRVKQFKLGYVVNFLDRDMLRALTFTDIVGTSKLGMVDGAQYLVPKTKREPDLEKLQNGYKVEIVTHIDPQDIQTYLIKRDARRNSSKTAEDAIEFRETLINKGIIGKHSLQELFQSLESEGNPVSDAVKGCIYDLMDPHVKHSKIDQFLWDSAEDIIYPLPDIPLKQWHTVDEQQIHRAIQGKPFALSALKQAIISGEVIFPIPVLIDPAELGKSGSDLAPRVRDLLSRLPMVVSGQIKRLLPEEAEAFGKALAIVEALPVEIGPNDIKNFKDKLFYKGIVGPKTLSEKLDALAIDVDDFTPTDRQRFFLIVDGNPPSIRMSADAWKRINNFAEQIKDLPSNEIREVGNLLSPMKYMVPNGAPNRARELKRIIQEQKLLDSPTLQDLSGRMTPIVRGEITRVLTVEWICLQKAQDILGEETTHLYTSTVDGLKEEFFQRGVTGVHTLSTIIQQHPTAVSDLLDEIMQDKITDLLTGLYSYSRFPLTKTQQYKLYRSLELLDRIPREQFCDETAVKALAKARNVRHVSVETLRQKIRDDYPNDPVALDLVARRHLLEGGDQASPSMLAREHQILSEILDPMPVRKRLSEYELTSFFRLLRTKGLIGQAMVHDSLNRYQEADKLEITDNWIERLHGENASYIAIPIKELEYVENVLKKLPNISFSEEIRFGEKENTRLANAYERAVTNNAQLADEIAAYELEHGLISYSISAKRLGEIRGGSVNAMLQAELDRIETVLALSKDIKLHVEEIASFDSMCATKGLIGTLMVKQTLKQIANPDALPDLSIPYQRQIIARSIWTYINAHIAALPDLADSEYYMVTDHDLKLFKNSRWGRKLRYNGLENTISATRESQGLPPLGLNNQRINNILDGNITKILAVEWQAIKSGIDAITAELEHFDRKVQEIILIAAKKEIFTDKALYALVSNYESNQQISDRYNFERLSDIWSSRYFYAPDEGILERIKDALDTIFIVSEADIELVQNSLEERGIPKGEEQFKPLLREVAKREIDRDNFDFKDIINRIKDVLSGNAKTLDRAAWDSMLLTIAEMPRIQNEYAQSNKEIASKSNLDVGTYRLPTRKEGPVTDFDNTNERDPS